jgi:hypothetical protein
VAFRWSKQLEQVAALLADGILTLDQIAATVGVSVPTIVRARRQPKFAARIEELLDDFRRTVRSHGIAVKERRIAAEVDVLERLQTIILERAEKAPDNVPGAKTGLLVKRARTITNGKTAKIVEEWALDTGLLKAKLAAERHLAIELGQWDVPPIVERPAERPRLIIPKIDARHRFANGKPGPKRRKDDIE